MSSNSSSKLAKLSLGKTHTIGTLFRDRF
jgi:hypothetical protein